MTDAQKTSSKSITLTRFLLEEQRAKGHIKPDLRLLIEVVARACKSISIAVGKGALGGVLGGAGSTNVQGEAQKKLDVLSNDILLEANEWGGHLAALASEEMDDPHPIPHRYPKGEYLLVFDPLDGSSNLDVCGGVGTIFSILRHDRRAKDSRSSLLQPGAQQVAAGYVLYGSSTVFMLTVGHGVDMFVLDPSIGAFMLVERGLRTPTKHKSYSVNEGNRRTFPDGYQRYLDWAQDQSYSSRYVGSMVADVHRILLKGGVFMYPPTKKAPNGKLRLMYEANPMAFLVEQAGGKALVAPGQQALPSALLLPLVFLWRVFSSPAWQQADF